MALYGRKEIERASLENAIEVLLVTDRLSKADTLVERENIRLLIDSVQKTDGTVHILKCE